MSFIYSLSDREGQADVQGDAPAAAAGRRRVGQVDAGEADADPARGDALHGRGEEAEDRRD